MFIIARICGVAIYLLVMLLFGFIAKNCSEENKHKVLASYLAVLCIMAYLYVPYITTDIFRLNPIADSLAAMPFFEFLDLILSSRSGIFTLIYFRTFHGYLSPVTCFLVYGTFFTLIYHSSEKSKCPNVIMALVLLWVMTSDFYLVSITNIRSYLAASFAAFCIYREIFLHKFGPLNIFLYLCAIEVHSMGIVLVMFRFATYMLTRGQFSLWKMAVFPLIILIAVAGAPFYMSMGSDSADKFMSYYNNDVYSYIWERILFIIQTCIQVYILVKAYALKVFRDKDFMYYKIVVTLAVVVLVICNIRVPFVQRWIIFSAMLEIPILTHILHKETWTGQTRIRNFMIATFFLTFAIVSSRGNLCSLKFWE